MDLNKAKTILSNPNDWSKYTTNEIEEACDIGFKSISALENIRMNITILPTREYITDKFGITYGSNEMIAKDFKESVLKIINKEFSTIMEEEDVKK